MVASVALASTVGVSRATLALAATAACCWAILSASAAGWSRRLKAMGIDRTASKQIMRPSRTVVLVASAAGRDPLLGDPPALFGRVSVLRGEWPGKAAPCPLWAGDDGGCAGAAGTAASPSPPSRVLVCRFSPCHSARRDRQDEHTFRCVSTVTRSSGVLSPSAYTMSSRSNVLQARVMAGSAHAEARHPLPPARRPSHRHRRPGRPAALDTGAA